MEEQAIEKVILLFAGFLLTTIGGALWNFFLNKSSWERQSKQELHRNIYKEGTQFFDDLSVLIGKRFFFLQRYLWAIESKEQEKIEEREKEYYEIVKEWNSKFWLNRNKIRILIGEQFTKLLASTLPNSSRLPVRQKAYLNNELLQYFALTDDTYH